MRMVVDLKCFSVLLLLNQLGWWFWTECYWFQHNDHYSATKAEGEALVIKSNGTGGLLTCCIRPSSIFGPGDKLLVPSLVDAARAGKSKVVLVLPPIDMYILVSLVSALPVSYYLASSFYHGSHLSYLNVPCRRHQCIFCRATRDFF